MSDPFDNDDDEAPSNHEPQLPAVPDEEEEYCVGYRKPPRRSRFKPGQSGNPRGRKKGSRGLKNDLHDELNRVIEVKIGDYRFKGTTQQMMLRWMAVLAANGNLKASGQMLPLIMSVFGVEDRGAGKPGLSTHDEAILKNFFKVFGGDAGHIDDESVPPPAVTPSADPEKDT
jgi:hypothetical protein